MDKIDELLAEYNLVNVLSKETKKEQRILIRPLFLFLLLFVLFIIFIFFPTRFLVCMISGWIGYTQWFTLIDPILLLRWIGAFGALANSFAMYLWDQSLNGLFGKREFRRHMVEYRRKKFIERQETLKKVIEEKGMTCQQAYNLLNKKVEKLPKSGDKVLYIISISSVIVAVTNLLVVPFQNVGVYNYAEYFVSIFVVLLFLIPITFFICKFVKFLTESFDLTFLKKSNYRFVLKLLEDMLY